MHTAARWLVRIGLALLAVLAIAAATVFGITQARLAHSYTIPAETVAIPSDPAALERGKHVATISGCVDCHGSDLAGRVFFENAMVGRFVASNLTRGNGGVGGRFADADWIAAIRHGVRPDGKPLLVMPAKEYFGLSDDDLGALIGYLKSLPAVDRELPRSTVSPMGRVLMVALKDMAILSAERIDHARARPLRRPQSRVSTASISGYVAPVVTATCCQAAAYPARRPIGRRPLISRRNPVLPLRSGAKRSSCTRCAPV